MTFSTQYWHPLTGHRHLADLSYFVFKLDLSGVSLSELRRSGDFAQNLHTFPSKSARVRAGLPRKAQHSSPFMTSSFWKKHLRDIWLNAKNLLYKGGGHVCVCVCVLPIDS